MNDIIRKPIIGIKRTPITNVERVPIVGLAQEDSTEELEWDTVYEQLVNYIKFASKQVSEQYQTGVVQSPEDLFQEGQLILYHCYTIYKNKSIEQFNALFKASLWRKLREIGKKKQFIQVDIEDAYDLGYSDKVVEDMYEEFKLQQVAELLENSPIALTILKEFINPSTRTLWEAQMDIARKQMLKEQNYSVSVPKSVVIKGVHIQRALEISKTSFNENYKIVKNSVSSVYKLNNTEDFEDVLQKCI